MQISKYMSDVERFQHDKEMTEIYEEFAGVPGEVWCHIRTATEELVWKRMHLGQKFLVTVGGIGICILILITCVAVGIAVGSYR